MSYWSAYLGTPVDLTCFPGGARVLDVGCGDGDQLAALREAGLRPVGVEPVRDAARLAASKGLPVVRAQAEALPFRDGVFGGLLCKVVLPYTDERMAVQEIGRVLRSGGRALIYLHGIGYYLRYLLAPDEWRHRIYALRTVVNTWFYRVTGRRFPGGMGDTLFQSVRRMRRYYRNAGLAIQRELPLRRFLGSPVFIAHLLSR